MIFKREKELARKLEFDGLYITEQPEDDDIKGQWDRLVLNTPYVNKNFLKKLVFLTGLTGCLLSQLLPQQLLGQVCEEKGECLRGEGRGRTGCGPSLTERLCPGVGQVRGHLRQRENR